MKQKYTVQLWLEGNWYVAQCLEIDIASPGETESEALANIKEAIELFLEPPSSPAKAYYPEQIEGSILTEVEVDSNP
jgi:predicted RNase H-like HicB family nuclease